MIYKNFFPPMINWIHKMLFTTASTWCMEQVAHLLLNFKGFKIFQSCKEDLNLIAVELSYMQDDDPVFNDPAHDTNTCNFASEETEVGIQCQ